MNRAIAIAKNSEHTAQHRLVLTFTILAATGLAALFYAMNLYSLISHTVAIQKTQSKIAAASTAFAKLDSEYLRLSSLITPDSMSKHGLAEREVSLYVTKPAETQTASLSLSHEL